ncbi:DUF2163 domain-containing protein [bacterium]|nr:DUF2163 domain-containing protein [bacterium]
MRKFSNVVKTVLASDSIEFFFLIKLEFTQTYYLTSYSSDIDFDGNTYSANGGLYEYDSPKMSSVVDRESYRVVIADLSNIMLNEYLSNVVGKPMTVYAGFIDSNGYPITNPSDVIMVYKGFVDKPTIQNDFEKKLAILEGTSPMSDLDAVNTFYVSRDGMDQKNLSDTSFDDMYQDIEIKYKWGKV